MKSIKLLSDPSQHQPTPTKESKKHAPLSTDMLIPAMVIVVIRSHVLNLHSNLYYMRHFSFERNVEMGEYGIILSTER